MASSIEMIAHCLYHQTALWERGGRCQTCRSPLREAGDAWYCPRCLKAQPPGACPICTGQPWK
jgi:hypothetical protein